MKCLLSKLVAISVIFALLSGCATLGNSPASSPSTTDSKQTIRGGTGTGAAIGTLIGGIIGGIIGGKKGLAIGAGAGALLGAGTGYLAGSKVAEIKEKYANKEDQLNAEIKLTAQYNKSLRDENREALNQIRVMRKEIRKLKLAKNSLIIKVHKIEVEKKKINSLVTKNDNRIDYMSKELKALKDYEKSIAQTQDRYKVKKLAYEIKTLQKNIALLNKNNKKMAKLANLLSARS